MTMYDQHNIHLLKSSLPASIDVSHIGVNTSVLSGSVLQSKHMESELILNDSKGVYQSGFII